MLVEIFSTSLQGLALCAGGCELIHLVKLGLTLLAEVVADKDQGQVLSLIHI